mmetsp:Transcript_29390/g.84422  ORF Transcript_29390/g.84422 Transcript_29390/m.84422 type:complete len:211 (-) Transcript_29390:781-1413(-)
MADPGHLRLVGRLVVLQKIIYVLFREQQQATEGVEVDPPALAPAHDLSSELVVLGVSAHQLLVTDGPVLASLEQVCCGVQLLNQGQLVLKHTLEELGQRILHGYPCVSSPLLIFVGAAHVKEVRTHLDEEVPRAPLQVCERLVLRQIPVVTHERVADALHGDADLMGDARQDVDVDQCVLAVVFLAVVVRNGLEERLSLAYAAALPAPRD